MGAYNFTKDARKKDRFLVSHQVLFERLLLEKLYKPEVFLNVLKLYLLFRMYQKSCLQAYPPDNHPRNLEGWLYPLPRHTSQNPLL